MNKKAQVQMLETLAVLIIFFILVVLGIVFYAQVLKNNISVERDEQVQLDSIKIAQQASFLPELQCSEENIVSDNCIDIIKLQVAEQIMQDNALLYFDKFGFSRIEVHEIYPHDHNNWLLYDRSVDTYQSKIVTNIPISLFDPTQNRNAFGVMTVELFVQ